MSKAKTKASKVKPKVETSEVVKKETKPSAPKASGLKKFDKFKK